MPLTRGPPFWIYGLLSPHCKVSHFPHPSLRSGTLFLPVLITQAGSGQAVSQSRPLLPIVACEVDLLFPLFSLLHPLHSLESLHSFSKFLIHTIISHSSRIAWYMFLSHCYCALLLHIIFPVSPLCFRMSLCTVTLSVH